MLAELIIRNFAIIDELRVTFDRGLNVLTGETGAGKSIILDAMTLVLGGRADTMMIRSGYDEAYVEAHFELGPEESDPIRGLLEQEALDDGELPNLTLSRELRANGRNIARVNGRVVSVSLLRDLGGLLVDIHGQGEHLSLLKPGAHLPLLDAFAGLAQERAVLAEHVGRWRALHRDLRQLRQDQRDIAQRIDLLQFQVDEIRAANLEVGEEEDLRAERTRLANAEQLIQHAAQALALLQGVDDEAPAVNDLLGQAERALHALARLDGALEPQLEQLQAIGFQINELALALLDYQEKLEFNPGRLTFVEERIELIGRLKRKYGDTIEEVLAWGDRSARELESIGQSEERLEQLETAVGEALREIGRLAQTLSSKRQEAARRLAEAVEAELSDLHMERAQFEVSFRRESDEDGAYVGSERLAFNESGIDLVEFLVSANPGEPLRPLARVASGGETSRLMLALKNSLARVDPTPTLIFDEIDQGIGGRVGDVVGRKLWRLTAPAGHQVIVVTHLPQLAAYADGHFRVAKQQHGDRTTTEVAALDDSGRVAELAQMLGARGEHAVGAAEAILEHVATVKLAGEPQL